MGRVVVPSIVEIYLCDTEGVRLECLDYVTSYEYMKIANNIAPFAIRLPYKFNKRQIRLDNIIEIWRGHGPGTLRLDYCGFLRAWTFGDDAGQEYTDLYGFSTIELLARRIVANYSGSAQADMTDQADDMIKEVAKDQLGSDSATARNLTSVGGGFTIQANLADGQSITKAFAYKNVLEACQEIADASAQAGTKVYFDVVPTLSSTTVGKISFQLKTFTDQRGADHSWDSSQPIYVGPEWGNLENGALEFDYSSEANYCYVLGPGEGSAREITEVSDTTRMELSVWNRREGAKDARHLEPGDTGARTGEGYTYLEENKPIFRFSGDIIETPSFRYGIDWNFGDLVTASYAGYQCDAMIDKISVRRDESGQEYITAKLEVDEAISVGA